jgi:hypothetical protein
MGKIDLVDVVPGETRPPARQITWTSSTITGREIIRRRVTDEVSRYNRSAADGPDREMLVQPSPTENLLNGARSTGRKPLDAESQIDVALTAFRTRRVILLFNGEQVEDLDTPLLVTPVSEARQKQSMVAMSMKSATPRTA